MGEYHKEQNLRHCCLQSGYIDWRYRIKYVDDTLVVESIPQCSPSYLPFITANINTYGFMRNMRLNEKECKDVVIYFLKYQPTVIMPIQRH